MQLDTCKPHCSYTINKIKIPTLNNDEITKTEHENKNINNLRTNTLEIGLQINRS